MWTLRARRCHHRWVSGPSGQARSWSTSDVDHCDAFAYWRDLICATFVQLSATPAGDAPFRGRLHQLAYPDVAITEVRACGQRVRRTPRLIAGSSQDYLLASIQVGGRGRVEQDGRVAELRAGTMAFYDSTRPYTLHFDDAFTQLVVQLPRAPLMAAAGVTNDAAHVTAVCLDAEGPGAVVIGYFRSLAELGRRDPAGAQLLSAHAPAMLASALRVAAGGEPSSGTEVSRRRVLAHLRVHASDPTLDADTVARACHLSRRALFRLFEGEPLSFAATLRRVRVELVGTQLVAWPQRPVAAVGAACGFAGEAQFHRAFRAVTGLTPAEHRAGTQQQ